MRTLDAVFIVTAGVVAALDVVLGVATLARSGHQHGADLSRGRRIVAPWLTACVYLLLTLYFATLVLRDYFEPGTDQDELLRLAGDVFAVAGIVTGLAWFVIRSPRRHGSCGVGSCGRGPGRARPPGPSPVPGGSDGRAHDGPGPIA